MERNIKIYYIEQFLAGMWFTLPVWVVFQLGFLNYSQMGLVAGLAYAVKTVLELPSGAVADMLGRKKTVLIGWFISGLFFITTGLSPNPTILIISLLMIPVGVSLVSGADKALLYDTLKELKREKDFSKIQARSQGLFRLAMIVSIFSGGYLYQIFIALPYILRGLLQIAIIIPFAFAIEPKIDSEVFSLKNYVKQNKQGMKELFKNTHNKSLTTYYVLIGGISWAGQSYYNNILANDVGFDEIGQSKIFATIYIVTTLAIILLAEQKITLTKTKAYISLPIILILSLIPGIFANKLIAYLMITGVTFVGGFRFAFLISYINEELESKYRATAVSGLHLLVGIFFVVIVSAGGWIQENYSTGMVYSLMGLLALISLVPSTYRLITNLHSHKTSL